MGVPYLPMAAGSTNLSLVSARYCVCVWCVYFFSLRMGGVGEELFCSSMQTHTHTHTSSVQSHLYPSHCPLPPTIKFLGTDPNIIIYNPLKLYMCHRHGPITVVKWLHPSPPLPPPHNGHPRRCTPTAFMTTAFLLSSRPSDYKPQYR